jgi:acetate---CoA ligase (ADP-forming)
MTATDRPIYRHQDLHRLLHPASIAVIGASTRAGSFGERVLNNLQDYNGRIYAVNARYERIGERVCYQSVPALPEVPDCAVVCVPRESVEEVARQCAATKVGGIVVFASGYAEVGKPDRIAEQERLGAIARESGMPIIGPNCIGTMNIPLQARVTFMVVVPPPELRPGAVGLISQSGALGFSLAQAAIRGVSFSHVLTYGNGCDVDMADYVAFLAEEPSCSVIACVFEGMARPERLMQAARLAWNANKPMIVYKMATGEEGAAAAMSHTGSLAGSHAAYGAAFRRAGVVLVDTYEQLIDTATFFAKAPEPAAEGVAVLATSGGAAIMCADHAERHRVKLPQPDERILFEHKFYRFLTNTPSYPPYIL